MCPLLKSDTEECTCFSCLLGCPCEAFRPNSTNLWSVSIPHTTLWWRTACVWGPCQTSGWRKPGPRGCPSSRRLSGRVWTAALEHGIWLGRSETDIGFVEDLRREAKTVQHICLQDLHLKCFHRGEHTEPSLFLKSRPFGGWEIDNKLSAKLKTFD